MAGKTGRGGKGSSTARRRSKAGRKPSKRGYFQIALERIKSVVTTVALLATGALIASWWISWRETEIRETPNVSTAVIEPGLRVKVEVLNGSGEPGAAGVIGDLLLGLEYDVVAVDNAENFDFSVTHVIDRSGAGMQVADIARLIGADSVAVALDPDLLLDATIILGKDWRELKPGG